MFLIWRTECACYTKRSKVSRSRRRHRPSNAEMNLRRPIIDEENACHHRRKKRSILARRRRVQPKSNTRLRSSPRITKVSGDTWYRYLTKVTLRRRSSSPDACKISIVFGLTVCNKRHVSSLKTVFRVLVIAGNRDAIIWMVDACRRRDGRVYWSPRYFTRTRS